ncbi:MAG: TonB family protein [Gemmatimonadaceae bacterium]
MNRITIPGPAFALLVAMTVACGGGSAPEPVILWREASVAECTVSEAWFADSTIVPAPAVAECAVPLYPDHLRIIGIEGDVIVAFRVDSAGMPDTTTIEVVETVDVMFTDAVLASIPHIAFEPARRAGRPTSVWVKMPFSFELESP